MSDLPEYFQKRIVIDAEGCWLWTGSLSARGYGRAWWGGKRIFAHRFVYQTLVEPLIDGLVIDHLCRVHNCVNPEHLRQVTQAENVRAGLAPKRSGERMAAKTHCPQGHEYTTENTRTYKGSRYCKTCNRARMKIYSRNKRKKLMEEKRE